MHGTESGGSEGDEPRELWDSMDLEEPMELQFNDEGAMEGGGGDEVLSWELEEPMATAEDAVRISTSGGLGDGLEGEDALEIHIAGGEGDERVEVGVEEALS